MASPASSPTPEPHRSDREPAALGLEMLYRSERHALMRFIIRQRTTPDDASDVAQEAFLRLAQGGETRTQAIAKPGAFLRQIARNLLRDRMKLAARRSEHLHIPYDDAAVGHSDEVGRLEARDGLARIEAVMRRMKPRTREIFMAHRLDGLTYAEIAARTGMSVSGVEKQMTKAIAMLMRHADLG